MLRGREGGVDVVDEHFVPARNAFAITMYSDKDGLMADEGMPIMRGGRSRASRKQKTLSGMVIRQPQPRMGDGTE